MTLSEQDAYALRRAVSMMDVPTELKISPLVELLLSTLDWKNNPAHWSLLQQIVTHDPTVSAQILRVDPMRDLSTTNRDKDETFVPALAKSAQLSDKLIAATETVGTFHSDCMAWLSKRSPMTPRIFLDPALCGRRDWRSPDGVYFGSASARCSRTSTICGLRRLPTITRARD